VILSETLFDRNYPGHYFRRIKSMSLSVEFAGTPQPSSVNCTLTLLKNSLRMNTAIKDGYTRQNEDSRFRNEIGAVQSIVTSSGKNDSGLFELNFNDERYLPFEGAGVIGEWRLAMSQVCNPALESLDDVIFHMNYTARDGGVALMNAALQDIAPLQTK
jgi:hypothetical protein